LQYIEMIDIAAITVLILNGSRYSVNRVNDKYARIRGYGAKLQKNNTDSKNLLIILLMEVT